MSAAQHKRPVGAVTGRLARRIAVIACSALAGSLVLTGCSSAASDQASSMLPSAAASAPASTPAPSLGVLPPTAAPSGASGDLPASWPAGLPAYVGGQLSTVSISEDGFAINATWSDDASRQDAFDAMQSALQASGFQPTSESGGEDMLITTEDMISNDYIGDAFDVNVTVVTAGAQSTIMLNASRR